MKEKPILFSTPMVQAILDGRKTQTRRAITPNNTTGFSIKRKLLDFSTIFSNGKFGVKVPQIEGNQDSMTRQIWRGQCRWEVGDLLWVRETVGLSGDRIFYRADQSEMENAGLRGMYDFSWTPSIHMPKDAARIWLEVTEVRAERLNAISEDDAKAEGVESFTSFSPNKAGVLITNYVTYGAKKIYPSDVNTAKTSFETLWESINGEGSWNTNPWVWVVCFKVVSTTGKNQPIS